MTVSMDDLLYLRRHLNTSHSCICVGSDLTPATVARTSSASHLRHSLAVSRRISMLNLFAQSFHVELVLFVPLRTDSKHWMILSSSQQSDGCVALPRTVLQGRDFLVVLTCVAMRLPSTLSSLASRRIFGRGTLRCIGSPVNSSRFPGTPVRFVNAFCCHCFLAVRL